MFIHIPKAVGNITGSLSLQQDPGGTGMKNIIKENVSERESAVPASHQKGKLFCPVPIFSVHNNPHWRQNLLYE